MNKSKQREHLRLLKILNEKLTSEFNINQQFKKIYESTNKEKDDDKKDEYIIISTSKNRNIFSEIPKDLINHLSSIGYFDKDVFDIKNGNIAIKNYYELLKTIRYLIDILEFDLMYSFAENNGLSDLTGLY
jgi:hypothetical protein